MGWTVAATTDEGRAVQNLLYLVASTAKFQTLTGSANATAALTKCHYDADDTAGSRPRCIVLPDDYQINDVGYHNERSSGELLLSFEFPVAAGDLGEPDDELAAFLNDAETIINQMRVLSGTGSGYFSGCTHFCMTSIRREDGPEVITETPDVDAAEDQQTFAAIIYRVGFNSVPG